MNLVQKIQGLMKALNRTPLFDRVLEKVTLVSATPGKVVCELRVEEEHTNARGTLHGGLTSTLVDCVSTYALLSSENSNSGASTDLNISFLAPAKIGDDILITAQVLKQGKTLAFASVDLTNKATGETVARGRHTKFMLI